MEGEKYKKMVGSIRNMRNLGIGEQDRRDIIKKHTIPWGEFLNS